MQLQSGLEPTNMSIDILFDPSSSALGSHITFVCWGIDFAGLSVRACDIDVDYNPNYCNRQIRRVRYGQFLCESRSFVRARTPCPLSLRERICEQ